MCWFHVFRILLLRGRDIMIKLKLNSHMPCVDSIHAAHVLTFELALFLTCLPFGPDFCWIFMVNQYWSSVLSIFSYLIVTLRKQFSTQLFWFLFMKISWLNPEFYGAFFSHGFVLRKRNRIVLCPYGLLNISWSV